MVSSCSSILHVAVCVMVLLPCVLTTDAERWSSPESGSQPGMKVIVTSKALKYLSDIWVPVVKDNLAALELKDFTGTVDILSFISVAYNISNISINELEIGKSSINSEPDTGLILRLDNGTLKASANWQFSLGGSLAKMQGFLDSLSSFLGAATSFQGTLRASAEGVTVHTGILVRSEEGLPRVNVVKCSIEVKKFGVKFEGDGSPWLNQRAEWFEGILKEQLNRTACDKIKELLEQLDQHMPAVIPVDSISGIDLTLTGQPKFTTRAIEAELKGDFRSITQPNTKIPDRPTHLPSPPPSWTGVHGKMAYVMATDYVANTAALVYMRAGKFRYDVTADSVNSKGSFLQLDTTTFSLVAPELFHRFGNQSLMLTIRATKTPPKVSFTESGADFSLLAAVDVYVVCNQTTPSSVAESDPACDGTMPLALTLEIGAEASAVFWLSHNSSEHKDRLSIKGNATYLDVTLKNVTRTNIGHVDLSKIFKLATALRLVQTKALPRINKWANKGLAVPNLIVQGLTFDRAKLKFHKGYATVETDISYESNSN